MRFRCSDRDSHEIRDFLMPVTFDVVQDKNGSGPRWQHGNGLLEVKIPSVRSRNPGGVGKYRDSFHAFSASGIATVCAERDIHGQPVQPTRKSALAPEAAKTLPTPDEHILCKFARTQRVTRKSQAKRVDSSRMLPVQLLERGVVARASPANQFGHARRRRCNGNGFHRLSDTGDGALGN